MGFQESFNTRTVAAMDRAFGISATIKTGSLSSETDPFTAVWEDQKYETTDREGFATSYHSRDFMFAVADVILDSEQHEPQAGDVIAIEENSVAKEFTIVSLGDMPAVELMPGGYRYRVHTKRSL